MYNSIRSKMLVTMLGIILLYSGTFFYFSQDEIETAVVSLEEESVRNILQLALLTVENGYENLCHYKSAALAAHKKELKNIVSIQESYVRHFYQTYRNWYFSENAAKQSLLDQLRHFKYGDNDYLWIADYNSVLISHPDPKLYGADFSDVKDVRGNLIVPPMVEMARKNGEGYYSYWWRRLGQEKHTEKLSYFKHFPEWEWVLGTGVYIDDIEDETRQWKEAMLNSLRQTFSKIRIAKTGYAFAFDENRRMLIHPTIPAGLDASHLRNPETENSILDELVAASKNPEIPFDYLWDKPSHPGEYRFWKEAYMIYYKPLGWYIGVSVYQDELHGPGRQLRRKIIGLAGVFLIITGGIILLLTRTLTTPIRRLTETMKQVKERGVFQANVPVEGSYETCELGQIFNEMLHHLHRTERLNAALYRDLKASNKTLQQRVAERTYDIHLKNIQLNNTLKDIERANRQLMENLEYARMIQQSLLPSPAFVRACLPESFTVWQPRDQLGGDIFYIDRLEDGIVIAVMDCTGHGVSGALMTMLAFSGFRRIVREENIRQPSRILENLNKTLKSLREKDLDNAFSHMGLDAGVCFIDNSFSTLVFAGARMPLFYTHKNETKIQKGDRQSIGYGRSNTDFQFTDHAIPVESGGWFYLLTDGFTDQTGGEKHIAFGKKRFATLIRNLRGIPAEKQQKSLMKSFDTYRGNRERLDDLTLFGFSLKPED